jgi:hypothetical protein
MGSPSELVNDFLDSPLKTSDKIKKLKVRLKYSSHTRNIMEILKNQNSEPAFMKNLLSCPEQQSTESQEDIETIDLKVEPLKAKVLVSKFKSEGRSRYPV